MSVTEARGAHWASAYIADFSKHVQLARDAGAETVRQHRAIFTSAKHFRNVSPVPQSYISAPGSLT